jgi:hypothetical protein
MSLTSKFNITLGYIRPTREASLKEGGVREISNKHLVYVTLIFLTSKF